MTASLPHAERLLAEASAPDTPGERLRVILDLPRGNPWPPPLDRIEAAALANPALPLDLLRDALLRGRPPAWLNPGATLAMLAHPDPSYPDAALRALVAVERQHPGASVPPIMRVDATALERRVRWWLDRTSTHDDAVRAFARHLSAVLGLATP